MGSSPAVHHLRGLSSRRVTSRGSPDGLQVRLPEDLANEFLLETLPQSGGQLVEVLDLDESARPGLQTLERHLEIVLGFLQLLFLARFPAWK